MFVRGSPCVLRQVSQQTLPWLVSLQDSLCIAPASPPASPPERKDGTALTQGLEEVREGPSHPSLSSLLKTAFAPPPKPFRTNLDTASCHHTRLASGRDKKSSSTALLLSGFTQDPLVTTSRCLPHPPPQCKEPLPGPSMPSSPPTRPRARPRASHSHRCTETKSRTRLYIMNLILYYCRSLKILYFGDSQILFSVLYFIKS